MRAGRILFILCILYSMGVMAQLTTKKINHRISLLQSQGVDTILCYSYYCTGSSPNAIVQGDSCISSEKKYVLWCLYGKYYRQRFDECRNYPIMQVDRSPGLSLVKDSLSHIRKASILPVSHQNVSTNNHPGQVTVKTVDHTCYTDFQFFIAKNSFTKRFSQFDLETVYIDDDKTPNDNYTENQRSILKRLKDLVEKEITGIPSEH